MKLSKMLARLGLELKSDSVQPLGTNERLMEEKIKAMSANERKSFLHQKEQEDLAKVAATASGNFTVTNVLPRKMTKNLTIRDSKDYAMLGTNSNQNQIQLNTLSNRKGSLSQAQLAALRRQSSELEDSFEFGQTYNPETSLARINSSISSTNTNGGNNWKKALTGLRKEKGVSVSSNTMTDRTASISNRVQLFDVVQTVRRTKMTRKVSNNMML